MHEIAIARELWTAARKYAEEKKISSIEKLCIVLGETSGFEETFLRHSLVDHIFKGTPHEKIELIIEIEKLKAKCNQCGLEITKENVSFQGCPSCASMNIEIVSGKDTYVKCVHGI